MPSKKYIPSNSIKKRIIEWEGSSMQTNRSFDLEAADFLRRLEMAKIYDLMSQDELDALFSYSYNVGSTTFAKRTIPHLVKLYNGTGTLNNVLNNIYGTKDRTLPGLRKRRNVERLLFKDAYNRRISLKKIPKAHTYLSTQEIDRPQQELNSVPSYAWNPSIILQKPDISLPTETQTSYNPEDLRYPTKKRVESLRTGGRLIKKGQYGTPIYSKTLYLQKDGDEQESKHGNLKSWIPDIRPEERMDLTTLLLKDGVSTYKPTRELQIASLGIAHPFHWYDYLTAAPIAVPVVGAAVATAPEWGPAALTTISNPTFWGELLKDTGTYIAADATSQGLTGKDIGAHVNNVIGLEEDHPVGELVSFSTVPPIRKIAKSGAKEAINLTQGYRTVIPRFILNVKNSDMASKTERTLRAIPTIINPKRVKIFAKSPELLDNIPIYHLKDFSVKELADLLTKWAKEAAKGPYSPNYDFYLGLNKGEHLSLDFLSARDLLSMEKLAERYGKYLSTRYNQLLEKITDPVLRHIVEVSPLYMEEVYALLMNVGKATPEFVEDLIKRANSYRRFMNRPFSEEDFSRFNGHSIIGKNLGSIDVEGRVVSGHYGPFPAYFEGLPNLVGDFSTWWDQRIPQGVNVNRGMHDSDIAGTKLINKIYDNKNLRHTNTISVMQIFNKNYTGPRGFIDWPVHLVFYGPRGTQLPNFRITTSRPPEGFKFGKGYKLGGKLMSKK